MAIVVVPTTFSDTAGGAQKLIYKLFPSLKPAFTSHANNKKVTVNTTTAKKKAVVVVKKTKSAAQDAGQAAADAAQAAADAARNAADKITGAGDTAKMLLYVVLAVVVVKVLKD